MDAFIDNYHDIDLSPFKNMYVRVCVNNDNEAK